jgi:hypothetical protein
MNNVGAVTISAWQPTAKKSLRVTNSPPGAVVMPVWRAP